MLQPAGTRPVLRAASPHCGLGPVAGLTLPQIHPAITLRPTAHSAFSTVWSPSMNKLQRTDRRRKAQRREARQLAQGQSQDRPHLFQDLQGAPTSLPTQASSCCSYPIALVSHQTGSHSIQAQGPGRDLTKLVMIQVNPRAKEPTHTEQLLQAHSCDFI